VPWLWWLVAGLFSRSAHFNPNTTHLEFVLAGVALGESFLEPFGFPVVIIPAVLRSVLSVANAVQS
jgi:hypothetical protein